jgi:hypothetical protein
MRGCRTAVKAEPDAEAKDADSEEVFSSIVTVSQVKSRTDSSKPSHNIAIGAERGKSKSLLEGRRH